MQNMIVIWGASGHALVVADIIRLAGTYKIVGFLDSVNPGRWGAEFGGSTILGGADQLDRLQKTGVTNLVVAIGDCRSRLAVAESAVAAGFRLASVFHPKAIVAEGVRVGDGTVIAAGAIVNPGSQLGSNVIVNTAASVDHECSIGDGVHVGPGARLGGRVAVGAGTWIGIGSVIRDHLTIGADSVIGAGAVVVDNIPVGVVAYGVPARVVRPNLET